MKKILLFVLVCALALPSFAQETFPISPIGTQRVFPGARITTNLSAVNHNLTSISLSGLNLPDFGSFQDKGKGFGEFLFEPNPEDVGTYLIGLQAISGTDTSKTTFKLIVPELPSGNKYYVDPVNGNNSNAGTAEQPWKTLKEVFATGKTLNAQDVLYLRSGNHGDPVINKLQSGITYILAEKGETPMFEKLNFYLAENWVLSGIKISPEANNISAIGVYLRVQSNCSNIVIENCDIYGTSDVMNWTTNQDWYDNAGDGALLNGQYTTFRNNYIYNVNFGLTVDGEHNIASHNLLNNFGGDGFRGIASNCDFLYNRIQNALVDDYATGNHDDGFQSWTFGAPVTNITLKGNQIISCTDPTLPLKTSILQGLVNFDGFSREWVVEDNLILVDHPHGLTLLGAINCKITNNTVINNPLDLFSYNNPPWIQIGAHKNGQPSHGNLIRNNLLSFSLNDNDPGTYDHNLLAIYTDHFANYEHWDFHPKANTGVINGGFREDGSTKDNAQHIRLDSFPDIGAYEFGDHPIDFENPTPVTNVQMNSLDHTSTSFSWDAGTDNYQVKRYQIITPTETIYTDSTEVQLLGLNPNTTYNIKVITEDLAGNTSSPVIVNFNTMDVIEDTIIMTIPVDKNDQIIKSNHIQRWVGLHRSMVGGFVYFYDASWILPFKLSMIPENYNLTSADLIVNFSRQSLTPTGDADLYALGVRSSSDALSTDDWQGAFGTQASAIPLQAAYVNTDLEIGPVKTADTTAIHLADYINGQDNINDQYLMLRLNINKDDESNYRFFEFTSGDHANTFQRPRLELTLAREPDITIQPKEVLLDVFPNPCQGKTPIQITWAPSLLTGDITVIITNINGQVIAKRSFSNTLNKIELPSDILPKNGAYFLTINDLKTYLVAKIIKE